MGEEFYSSIKLTTGEEIFSLVCIDENDGDPVLVLQNPVVMKMISTGGSYGIKIKPWMSIPGDDFFIIKLDKIITMTEVKDESMIEFTIVTLKRILPMISVIHLVIKQR